MEENKKELFRTMTRFSAVGLEMGLSVVIGLLMGIYLDRYLKTEPWMTIIFLMFGMAAAIRVMIRVSKESRDEDKI